MTEMMNFPAAMFLKFFENHGLLDLRNRPQWYTVSQGSQEYVKRLSQIFKGDVKLNCAVKKVSVSEQSVSVEDENGGKEAFDHVVFSSHADETLRMIDEPTAEENNILGSFQYEKNKVFVHCDDSFMPRNKKCWASWSYLHNRNKKSVSLSYWMNHLQNLTVPYPILVTLNPSQKPRSDQIFDEHEFTHPLFDQRAIDTQSQLKKIQGKRRLWFCGAYQRYGFHEDGLQSAVSVAKGLGATIPWQ